MVEELIKDWNRFDELWDNAKSEVFESYYLVNIIFEVR